MAGREAPGDVRQRNVGNGSVENFHERGQRNRQRDQPRIESRLPVGFLCVRHGNVLYFSQTFGTTDIPGRRRSRPCCPGLNRMRTGRRWTTLT